MCGRNATRQFTKRFADCFVGAPCSRGTFYAPFCLRYCVSPLPHGNRLVKATRLTANLGYDVFPDKSLQTIILIKFALVYVFSNAMSFYSSKLHKLKMLFSSSSYCSVQHFPKRSIFSGQYSISFEKRRTNSMRSCCV